MAKLQIFFLICYVHGLGLPGIYSRALANHIETMHLVKAIIALDNHMQSLISLIGNDDIPKFYSLIRQQRDLLEVPFRAACKKKKECLRLCQLLVDALEVEYRERLVKEGFDFFPSSMSEGLLFQALHIRLLEEIVPSSYNDYRTIKRNLDFVLRYLRLWEAIEQFGYGTVLVIIRERQTRGIRTFIQRSTQFYMNWLYRESIFLHPPLQKGPTGYWPNAVTWYEKMTDSVFPGEMTLELLASLLEKSVWIPLQRYQANPGTFDVPNYYALITDMLFLHQSQIELCNNQRVVCLELESTFTKLYAHLEELFEQVLKFMEISKVSLCRFELPELSVLRTTKWNYSIRRVEVLRVSHPPVENLIISTQLHKKNGTLRIHFLGAYQNLRMNLLVIKEVLLDIFDGHRTFKEDELNRYLEKRLICHIKVAKVTAVMNTIK